MFDGLSLESLIPQGLTVVSIFDGLLQTVVALGVSAYMLNMIRNFLNIRRTKKEEED